MVLVSRLAPYRNVRVDHDVGVGFFQARNGMRETGGLNSEANADQVVPAQSQPHPEL